MRCPRGRGAIPYFIRTSGDSVSTVRGEAPRISRFWGFGFQVGVKENASGSDLRTARPLDRAIPWLPGLPGLNDDPTDERLDDPPLTLKIETIEPGRVPRLICRVGDALRHGRRCCQAAACPFARASCSSHGACGGGDETDGGPVRDLGAHRAGPG
jgi:hypothetical protein